jgi:hypothetical protein
MRSIDKIVFGDNQFFGINHMSQDKAQQLSEKFYDIKNVFKVYDIAVESGIDSIMLNSNERAVEICNYFRSNESKYGDLNWYPSIPYPHKYANLVAEKGIFPALNEMLVANTGKFDILGSLIKGGSAIVSRDVLKLMSMLIDLELKMFRGLNVRVVFLQNIITDLLLGFGVKEVFIYYCDYIKSKYKVLPGFTTVNLPYCIMKFKEWGIEDVVICSSINKVGFTMSPDVKTYETVIRENDSRKYQIMAMSVMASGAIPAEEAYDYINSQNVQSVVFGASSQRNIDESLRLLNAK